MSASILEASPKTKSEEEMLQDQQMIHQLLQNHLPHRLWYSITRQLSPRVIQKEENPDFIKTGDAAIVKIVPTRPMVIEPSKKFPQLGRFAIRDMGQTVAAGICLDVEEAK